MTFKSLILTPHTEKQLGNLNYIVNKRRIQLHPLCFLTTSTKFFQNFSKKRRVFSSKILNSQQSKQKLILSNFFFSNFFSFARHKKRIHFSFSFVISQSVFSLLHFFLLTTCSFAIFLMFFFPLLLSLFFLLLFFFFFATLIAFSFLFLMTF